MPTTIYEVTAGALIATGERSVSTYASGLCRVDQSYICTNDAAETHRAALTVGADTPDSDDTPAVDGLKIFPAPQEIRRPDGFTEFQVSAYGRTSTGMQGVTLEQETVKTRYFSYNVWRISGSLAIMSGSAISLDDLDIDPSLVEPFGFVFANPAAQLLSLSEVSQEDSRLPATATYVINGQSYKVAYPKLRRRRYEAAYTLDGTTAAGTLQFWVLDPEIIISASRNFGTFTEVDITTKRDNTTPEVI